MIDNCRFSICFIYLFIIFIKTTERSEVINQVDNTTAGIKYTSVQTRVFVLFFVYFLIYIRIIIGVFFGGGEVGFVFLFFCFCFFFILWNSCSSIFVFCALFWRSSCLFVFLCLRSSCCLFFVDLRFLIIL